LKHIIYIDIVRGDYCLKQQLSSSYELLIFSRLTASTQALSVTTKCKVASDGISGGPFAPFFPYPFLLPHTSERFSPTFMPTMPSEEEKEETISMINNHMKSQVRKKEVSVLVK
jgi:hypothetical protein